MGKQGGRAPRQGHEGENENQTGARSAALVWRRGYRVRPGKEAWADELFAACERLGWALDYKRRPHLRKLSEHAGLRSRNTLQTQLQGPDYPEIRTLLLLEENAGVPVVRSLLALRVLTLARLEADRGISAPQVDAEALVSPALANLNAALPVLPREALVRLFDALLELRGPNPGNSHGPSPTAADH